jgi:hypothetical protein
MKVHVPCKPVALANNRLQSIDIVIGKEVFVLKG